MSQAFFELEPAHAVATHDGVEATETVDLIRIRCAHDSRRDVLRLLFRSTRSVIRTGISCDTAHTNARSVKREFTYSRNEAVLRRPRRVYEIY